MLNTKKKQQIEGNFFEKAVNIPFFSSAAAGAASAAAAGAAAPPTGIEANFSRPENKRKTMLATRTIVFPCKQRTCCCFYLGRSARQLIFHSIQR